MTIAAGKRAGSATLTVTPVADSLHEADETVQVQGATDTLGTAAATFTITDDDMNGVTVDPNEERPTARQVRSRTGPGFG